MSLFHKQHPGALPLVTQYPQAFPFQASPGHNYDRWTWLYPAQTNQYTYFNAFVGNQLPNFSVYVPVLANVKQSVNFPWVTHTNMQQQNAMQSQGGATGYVQFGQQQSADYMRGLGQQWASLVGGGRRKPFGKMR